MGIRRALLALWILFVGLCSAGCSLQYIDRHGARHVVGLVHMTVKQEPQGRSQLLVHQVSTIGAAALFLPEHSGIALGYTRNFSIIVNSADEAGELSFSPDEPGSATFKDFETVTRELRRGAD